MTFVLALAAGVVMAEESNPLGKVYELMDGLAAQITSEGEAEAKAYKGLFAWCDDSSKTVGYDIKTGTSKKEKLGAKIDETFSDVEVGTSKIADLTSAIATADKDLKGATQVRGEERKTFADSEKELVSVVDTLERATSVLEKEMAKSSSAAAFAQLDTSNMKSVLKTLGMVVDAAAFSSVDKNKLMVLAQTHVQEQTETDDDDSELGTQKVAASSSKSGGIVELLEDMKEKAEGELSSLRKQESEQAHNYGMLKQSLDDQIAEDSKHLSEEKSGVAAAKEENAIATADEASTEAALKQSHATLATTKKDCMQSAGDHEATVAARVEELKVIATAKKILQEATGGAASLLQVASRTNQRSQLAASEVVTMVRKLATEHHSTALSQLASRIAATIRYGSGSNGPFDKVKGLITSMISKLEKQAEAESSEKAYCDEEMGKTEAKKGELGDDLDKLTSKIDKSVSRSAELKEEVAELQSGLADLAKMSAEADKVRETTKATYETAKAELTQGLDGVRKALGVLRDYYGGGDAAAAMLQDDAKFGAFMQQPQAPEQHEKSSGAGGAIINILEVCESDFATNLAKEETEESDKVAAYADMSQESKVTKATKEQDVKYKNREAAGLDKDISTLSSDREGTNTENKALLEFYAKLKERCVAKPESYEDKKARREAEINGLKEAMSVLEKEAAFVQVKHRRGGARHHFMEASE